MGVYDPQFSDKSGEGERVFEETGFVRDWAEEGLGLELKAPFSIQRLRLSLKRA